MAGDYGGRGRFADELLDEIRSKSDIVAVIGEYVPLKKRGNNFLGLCPFHQEKTPSFTVTPDKQMFYCFGCQTGGNVFSFLMKREGLSFGEAVEHLAARAGVVLPERERRRAGGGPGTGAGTEAGGGEEKRREERDLLYRIMDFASRYYHKALLESPEAEKARLYLRRRGIRPESVESFRLGYSPRSWDSLLKALRAKDVGEAPLEKAGLILKGREGYYDRFRGRLMFTICDQRGRPIGFGARALDEGDEPRYLNSPETPLFSKSRALYALHLATQHIRRGGSALVVEGYMDVITCHEFGFGHTVASMGTAFTPDQARALRRHTDTVVTAFDSDAAGTQATVRGLEILTAAGFKMKVAEMPGGKDPDDCLRGDPEAFRAAVDGAVPLAEYRFRLALRRFDPTDIDGRVAAVNEILPVLASIESLVEREEYLREFARRLPVPEDALRAELARYVKARSTIRRSEVRDRIESWRNNKEALAGAGKGVGAGLPRPVRDAERALLGLMAGPEEALHMVLAELLEAAAWCAAIGLASRAPGAGAAPPDTGTGPTEEAAPTGSETGLAEAAATVDQDAGEAAFEPTGHELAALEWFLEPVHRRVAVTILHLARYGLVEPAKLVDALAGEEEVAAVTGALVGDDGRSLPEEIERAIRDYVAVLKEHRLNSRIGELHRRISDLERKGAKVEQEYAELLRELIDLERHTDGGTGHWAVPGDCFLKLYG